MFKKKCYSIIVNTVAFKVKKKGATMTDSRALPSVDASDTLVLQDGDERVEAGFVLARLGALTTQLHPVLHQVQRLYKDGGAHPG